MPVTVTPLRYPGGKTQLYTFIRNLLVSNNLLGTVYCEPFAGGCGLALKLLLNDDVSKIIINDSDRAIYAFWYSVLHNSEELCSFVDSVDITVEEHEKQKYIYMCHEKYGELDLAKATLFLNRTNVSGVLKGGIIGGRCQNGKYGIDARFPKEGIKKKIRRIAELSDRIDLYNLDVFEFLDRVIKQKKKVFINFDPPYVKKGGQLYKNSFDEDLHRKLSNRISQLQTKWIVTYDICDLIESLYSRFRHDKIEVSYTVNTVRKAKECVFYSDNLIIP